MNDRHAASLAVPPLLIGAALAFWGWQSGNLVAGLLLGSALEALRALPLRIDLGVKEHSSIADLSTVGFVLLVVLLAANRGIGHGILEAFIWQPVALSPILAAQLVSPNRRLPLSALFRYLRKLRRAHPEIRDPQVDASAIYAALALLTAGVANQRGPEYYLGVVVGAALLLHGARPKGASLAAGAALLGAAALIGHAGHVGLQQAQLALVDWVIDLNVRSLDTDPYRTRSELGSVGRLKKYDAIVLRVYAGEKEGNRIQLLHRSSYNSYFGGIWVARGARMAHLDSLTDNETWVLDPGDAATRPPVVTRLSARFENGRLVLPLPAGTVRLGAFPATRIEHNALGAVHAQLGVDWANYEALADPNTSVHAGYAPPTPEDSAVPSDESAMLERVVDELALRELPPAERLKRIERHLGGFTYSTFRERPVAKGETALGDFLNSTRAGHCEYFATAATLLARAAGVPARYATGYAAIEYSPLEGAWVVRARHAHAWSRAWIDGRWTDVDSTPAAWGAEEADQAPVWQGLADLFRYAGFRWSQRGEIKAGDSWYAVLGLLALYLGWSVLRGRRRVREREAAAPAVRPSWPGEDSEFYRVEKSLPPRAPSETQGAWLARIDAALSPKNRSPVLEALRLHQRYRFDPQGLSRNERNRLRELCRGLAAPA